VCCSVLQCVKCSVYCSALQCIQIVISGFFRSLRFGVCCSVCVAVCVLQFAAVYSHCHIRLLQLSECRSVLQSVCCSVCVAVCCSVLHCVAVCCSVLLYVVVCCSVLLSRVLCLTRARIPFSLAVANLSLSCAFTLVLQCVAVCCSVLQCVAVCCSVLQRVEV